MSEIIASTSFFTDVLRLTLSPDFRLIAETVDSTLLRW